MTWKPRTFLALLVASMGCWLERQAAAQIEYLKAENRPLRSRLGRRRIVFTDADVYRPRRRRSDSATAAVTEFECLRGKIRQIRKSECLSKLMPIGAPMLCRALHEYMEHYHRERNHQGLGNKLIAPILIRQSQSERIDRRSHLGGLLNFYERAAA
jgi:hypothetical protein